MAYQHKRVYCLSNKPTTTLYDSSPYQSINNNASLKINFKATVRSQNEAVQVSETVCRNATLANDCNLTVPSSFILWRSEVFGVLLFSSQLSVGKVVRTTSYRAVLTGNVVTEPTQRQNLLASTLYISPPLDELSFNGTNFNGSTITCEGSTVELSINVSIAGKTKYKESGIYYTYT